MKILLAGAYGQVGQELIRALSKRYALSNIICADVREPPSNVKVEVHEHLNVLDRTDLEKIIKKHQVKQVYCLAALLSATGEKDPLKTEQINMNSLFNCLELARQGKFERLFWPSSIAAFGSNTPKRTPQLTIMEPNTVYGITKKSGELWCNYYHARYGVDVRSLRYPGLVGYRSPPGGGTTDYAVDIFHKAIMGQKYTCYLGPETYLPMIYTDDAIDGTLQLMDAEKEKITVRTSYNMNGITFNPRELAAEIKKNIPKFEIEYNVQKLRQGIADSWPHYLEDDAARKDWGWQPKYDLERMTKEIITNLTPEMIKAMAH